MRIATPLAVALLFALPGGAHEHDCSCEVSDSAMAQADAALNLSESEQNEAEASHLLGGIPAGPSDAVNEHLLHQTDYIISYDDDLRIPLWVAYRLRAQDICKRARKNCFRRDLRISDDDDAAFCEDYEEPVFDRGHMVPRGSMNRTQRSMINTFMFTNMVPQHADFNRKIWKWLEEDVRCWARSSGSREIYVITGAVFDRLHDGERDPDDEADRVAPRMRVAVPTDFYKIVLHERPSGFIDTISLMLPHDCVDRRKDRKNRYLRSRIVSIDEIEAVTGVRFLPDLAAEDPEREAAVTSFRAPGLWQMGCGDPPPC